MSKWFSVCLLVLVAGCSASRPIATPTAVGGNRADGIVALSSTTSIYRPGYVDQLQATEKAEKSCRAWGFRERPELSGTRESCILFDRWGRCERTRVDAYYDCTGGN